MSQDNIDSSFRQLLDDHYPFIEQGAEPPGRFQQYRNGPGQTWSGESGWRTRHGDAVVMWSLGRPNRVWSARLADGTAIEAMATLGSPSPWRYQLAGEPRRWVHGTVEIGPDRVTFTSGQQPTYQPPPPDEIPNLEVDLARQDEFRRRLANELFADLFYWYLANHEFGKEGGERIWPIGLSSAGALVANLRGHGDTYIDYYPHGGAGPVTDQMRQARRRLGKPEMSPEEATVQQQKLDWLDEIGEMLRALGWRKATPADKATAAAFTRRDLALWEQRPEAARPDWTQKMVVEPKAEGWTMVRQGLLESMTEKERQEHQELVSRALEKRLYRLAISGRISESEWRSMFARILAIPRNFSRVDPDVVRRSPYFQPTSPERSP